MAEDKKETKPKRQFFDKTTGRHHDILRTYFDPRENCVIDEYEVSRTFKDSEKKTVTITARRRAFCQDAELQKQHRVIPDSGVKEL